MQTCKQRGFTLPEALISATIAAGVIAAASTSLSTSLKATQKSAAAETMLHEARNLSSVLKSSILLTDIERDYEDWKFNEEVLQFETTRRNAPHIIKKINVSSRSNPEFSFSIVRITKAETK